MFFTHDKFWFKLISSILQNKDHKKKLKFFVINNIGDVTNFKTFIFKQLKKKKTKIKNINQYKSKRSVMAKCYWVYKKETIKWYRLE